LTFGCSPTLTLATWARIDQLEGATGVQHADHGLVKLHTVRGGDLVPVADLDDAPTGQLDREGLKRVARLEMSNLLVNHNCDLMVSSLASTVRLASDWVRVTYSSFSLLSSLVALAGALASPLLAHQEPLLALWALEPSSFPRL
jgi:hypothetical protein